VSQKGGVVIPEVERGEVILEADVREVILERLDRFWNWSL